MQEVTYLNTQIRIYIYIYSIYAHGIIPQQHETVRVENGIVCTENERS